LSSRESEGSFQYGNYYREVEDLRAIVQHFREKKYEITAIVGHSKGQITVNALMLII
jgi:alpha/beta superfamily hydrolase